MLNLLREEHPGAAPKSASPEGVTPLALIAAFEHLHPKKNIPRLLGLTPGELCNVPACPNARNMVGHADVMLLAVAVLEVPGTPGVLHAMPQCRRGTVGDQG